jgi:excisionase family DNA binding protein
MYEEGNKEVQIRWPALMEKSLAAQYLSVSKRTFERMVGEGLLTAFGVRERTLRFKKADLDRFIDGLKPSRGGRPGEH